MSANNTAKHNESNDKDDNKELTKTEMFKKSISPYVKELMDVKKVEMEKIDSLNKNTNTTDKENFSDQIKQISSIASIGFPDKSPSVTLTDETHKTVQKDHILDSFHFESEKDRTLYDIYCLAVICFKHKQIALHLLPNKCYFLPFVRLSQNVSFDKLFKEFLRFIIVNPHGKATVPQVIDIFRVEQPMIRKYVTRYIFKTIIYPNEDNDSVEQKCCINTEKILWSNLDDLHKFLNPNLISFGGKKLWGNEPLKILKSFNMSLGKEILHENNCDDMLKFANKNSSSFYNSIFQAVNFDQSDLKMLFNEFTVQCYPSESMTFASFCVFAAKILLRNYFSFPKLRMIFNSFHVNHNYALTINDLVFGLAIMDQSFVALSTKYTTLLDIRFNYFFRFYDIKCQKIWTFDELLCLMNDYGDELTTVSDDKSLLPQVVTKEDEKIKYIHNLLQQYGQKEKVTGQLYLNSSQARTAINQSLNINKLSSSFLPNILNALYRIPFDVMSYMGSKFNYKKIHHDSLFSFTVQDQYKVKCLFCCNIKFSLSNHLVRLSKVGEIFDVVRLEPLSGEMGVSFVVDIPEQDIYLLANDIIIRLQRFAAVLFSNEFFDQDELENNNEDLVANWFFPTKNDMFESVRLITQSVLEIFSKEPRVIEINGPCYIFGDIHGNFKDLIGYSHYFWRCSPFLNYSKCLFLGDYVDRGQWGIEVILYLFSLKILAPNNFFILRGNHEIREVQEQFSFFSECRSRLSIELWEMINDCFDRMPIAAVVDSRLYCAHGGIPASVTTISQIQKIPCPIENPLQQSIETWEVLWNDPINASDLLFLPNVEVNFMRQSRGFARNIKRGTAYLFGEEAINNFLQRNDIDYVLRAHEVFQAGYFFYVHGHVITVFSSSKYSNLNNSAAILFVKQNRIRIIRIENNDK